MSLLTSCNYGVIQLDVQGHRGCRGLMPENSLEGFAKAWELGATTLEMDVVITKDKQVVVSHEAWFDHNFCLDPNGNAIQAQDERKLNIYQLDYADVLKYDCGSKPYPAFPLQKKLKTAKPLLAEVFEAHEENLDDLLRQPKYNIELKRVPDTGNTYSPPIDEFVDLVLQQIYDFDVADRVTLQAFDVETLQAIQAADPDISLSLLIDSGEDYKQKLSDLAFYPQIISPSFEAVDTEMLGFAATKDMKVITWTVNEVEDMEKLIRLGVHGIITDYPDRLVALLEKI